MRVVENILHRIKDDEHVGPAINEHESVAELVKGYNRHALTNDFESRGGMYVVTGETYGVDLKRYIHQLPAVEQLRLLDNYLKHFPDNSDGDELSTAAMVHIVESDAVREERRLKHWMVKTIITFCLFSIFTLTGAVIAIMAHNKQTPDSVFIKTIMDTAAEVIKLLFSK